MYTIYNTQNIVKNKHKNLQTLNKLKNNNRTIRKQVSKKTKKKKKKKEEEGERKR